MNKKGQLPLAFLALMVGIAILVLAVGIAPTLKNVNDENRAALDCNNESISDWDKSNCLQLDVTSPFFYGWIIAIAGAVITARIIGG